MDKSQEVVFQKCPVCNRGPVVKIRSGLAFETDRCQVCGATFGRQGPDRYKLINCEPHTMSRFHPPGCTCAPRLFRECYLGMTFTRAEWERIAEGGQPNILRQFHDAEERFEKGELTPHPKGAAPFPLEPDEDVYFVSAPVYLHEEQMTRRQKESAHAMYITNHRAILAKGKRIDFEMPLGEIKSVKETLPGFVIERADSPTPLTIYPSLYDPVFAALEAILKKFGKQKTDS